MGDLINHRRTRGGGGGEAAARAKGEEKFGRSAKKTPMCKRIRNFAVG